MSTPTIPYDASNRLRPAVSPPCLPTTFPFQAEATPLRQVTDPAGGIYSYVYDDLAGRQCAAITSPGGLVTSMTFNPSVGSVEPPHVSTSLAWDQQRRPIARVAQTTTTLVGAIDALPQSPAIIEQDPLDQNLLASLDELLADPGTPLDNFYNLLTTEDERCISIWNTLCREAARDFGVDRKAVFDEACHALKRSLKNHGPHNWLREHRGNFVPWFSGVAHNHVRNATQIELRCDRQVHQIGEFSRKTCVLEHLCVRATDPGFAIDFVDAVNDMAEEVRAVFLRRCQSRLVGQDINGREIWKKSSNLEIAQELGISEPTVKRRWAKAKQYMQQRFPHLRIDDKD